LISKEIAFDQSGELYATARADGEVCRITDDSEVVPYASELGVATGLAFDKDGVMFVGDRSGTIFRVSDFGNAESFAVIEPSVSAYHLAFGRDGKLYVTAPDYRVLTRFIELTKRATKKLSIADSADRRVWRLTETEIFMSRRVFTADTEL